MNRVIHSTNTQTRTSYRLHTHTLLRSSTLPYKYLTQIYPICPTRIGTMNLKHVYPLDTPRHKKPHPSLDTQQIFTPSRNRYPHPLDTQIQLNPILTRAGRGAQIVRAHTVWSNPILSLNPTCNFICICMPIKKA